VNRVLLVGAGHAHATLLAALAEKPVYGASLTLVSPRERQVYSGMLPGVIAGHYSREDAEFDVAALARRAAAEFVEGEVRRFDPVRCVAHLSDGRELGFDLASLNVGSGMRAPDQVLPVKPYDAFLERLPRLARIAIGGAGAAGAELAMALRQRGAQVTLYSQESPFAGKLERRIVRALRWRGVDYRPGMRVDAIEAGPLVVAGAAHQEFDLVLWATGAQAAGWLRESGLAVDEGGFVRVDETLRSVSHPHVFAVGDCAASGEAKSGVHSVRQGRALETNLRHLMSNQPPVAYRKKAAALMLLSCGTRYAIASRGGWSAEGRWAWWWKDRIDRRWLRRLRGT
jgi:selenide,water dikinase